MNSFRKWCLGVICVQEVEVCEGVVNVVLLINPDGSTFSISGDSDALGTMWLLLSPSSDTLPLIVF